MRLALLALCLAGCFVDTSSDPYDDPYDDYNNTGGGGWGSGWGGDGGSTSYGCQSDSECGGLVCTRSGECLPASSVRLVRTVWTIDGAPATDATCAPVPKLSITFSTSAGEQFGYTPVPCVAGKFTVDKFPTRFTTVQLTRAYDYSGGGYGTFDATGTATLDLPY